MKKRIVAIACAAAMMLALPTLAWAAPSPSGQTVTGNNGVSFTVKAESGTVTDVASTSAQASNVQLSADEKVLASFQVDGDATNVTLTFGVGSEYAGASVKIFVQHNDGTTEVLTGTVAADGTVTVTVGKLSIFTIAVDATTVTGGTDAKVMDTSSKSPQTGVDLGTVAGATVVTAIAAGAVFVALRKKVTE